ncbi:hypothetical protein SLS60_009234 [Paraconiothyrium brasiliense]|uniref:Uncharacterized protein n=1 Tax=Paraconiothyrium brasiliense TaxID=300254 RepID=A0ABR3QWP9_9PLEO
MSSYRVFSENRYIKPRGVPSSRSFIGRFGDGLGKDSNSKHLVLLFLFLHAYAFQAFYNDDYDLAVATALPTLLLPYTWSHRDNYPTILGLPFYYILPYQGHTYPYPKWSAQLGRTFGGPARDGYANCFYTIPLYLALWYAFLAMVFPKSITTFVLIAVLLVSRPEYWFSEPKSHTRKRSALLAFDGMLFRLGGQFVVGASTWLSWTVAKAYMRAEVELEQAHLSQLLAVEQGPALALTCVLVIKVINTWKGIRGFWPDLLFEPYDAYWDELTPEKEIAIWEILAQLEQKRERGSGYGMKERNRAQALQPRDWEPNSLYQEESPEPEALYRGSDSGEEDVGAADGGGNDAAANVRERLNSLQPEAEGESTRERTARMLKEAFSRNPALAHKLIESQVQDLPPEKEAERRKRLEDFLVQRTEDRIANQRFRKAHRADTSIALTVPYNDSKSNLPSSILCPRPARDQYPPHSEDRSIPCCCLLPILSLIDPDPRAPQYVSIIEDPLARNPEDVSDDGTESDDSSSTDVYEADDRYPDNTFPHRAWRESLISTFGTVDMFFDRTKASAWNMFMFLVQGFSVAVLIRLSLMSVEKWPLEKHYTDDNIGVMWSTLGMIEVVLKSGLNQYGSLLTYWGRLVRDPVEVLLNDWLLTVFSLWAGGMIWLFMTYFLEAEFAPYLFW